MFDLTLITIKIKQDLRISHNKLDDGIQSDIAACIADLQLCGVVHAEFEDDPLILNAIKLWCRSFYIDDVVKAAEYMKRYESLKSCLMMAEGYGHPKEASDE